LVGARLDTATGLTTTDPAITAHLLPAGASEKREAELVVPAAAAVGPVRLTLTSPAGPSAPVRFIVDRYPAVRERGTADSAHAALPVTLPATVAGTIDRAGGVDYF